MRMDTAYLDTFRSVARHGSFTAAASALGYTQSAVSRQVSALEAELGAPLFDRLPRGVRLTEEGACVLTHVDALFDRLDVARGEIAALRDAAGGSLRVGAFPTAVATLIPRALAEFRAAHPKVALSLVEGMTRRHLSFLQTGDVHVAVVSAFPDQQLDEEQFDFVHLLDDAMFIAFPAGHPLAGRRNVRLAELADEAWIAGDASADDNLLGPASLRSGTSARVDFVVREWTAKLGLVAAGLGITLVPSLAADAARGDIALVPLDPKDGPPRSVYVATLRGVSRPAAVDAFVDVLRAA
jgi:DNA-binding transcriptional LysR family regulator